MSDESIIALAAVVVSGLVGIASLGFNFWNSSRERQHRLAEREQENREWYKRTLFEKRLQAAQQAYGWWRRLNEAVSIALDNDDPESAENKTVRELATQAREWYDNNSLCLGSPGPSHFVGLTNSALAWASGRREVNIQKSLNEVYDWVRNLADRLLQSERGGSEEGSA